jgi:hypothetical protein
MESSEHVCSEDFTARPFLFRWFHRLAIRRAAAHTNQNALDGAKTYTLYPPLN